jgi:hypothetical protein
MLPVHCAVRIRLSSLQSQLLGDLGTLLEHLEERLLTVLEPGKAATILAAARARPGGAKERLHWVLTEHILAADRFLILVLERADRLWGTAIQDDFFSLLRELMEQDAPAFRNLRLVVTVATEPMLLDTIDHSGFFSRTQPLLLSDLDDDEIRLLALRHNYRLEPGDLELVRRWLGGQPSLLRLAFHEAAQAGIPLRRLLEDRQLRTAIFRGHLLRLQRWLEHHPHLKTIVASLRTNPLQYLSPQDYGWLYSKALLREQEGSLRLRCQLYEDFIFSWLKPEGGVDQISCSGDANSHG